MSDPYIYPNPITLNSRYYTIYPHDGHCTIDLQMLYENGTLTSCSGAFYWKSGITYFSNLNLLDTRYVTDMSSMFENCANITTLDISTFNTDQVETFKNMFKNCYNLTEINLQNIHIPYNTENMFVGCENLNKIYLYQNEYLIANTIINSVGFPSPEKWEFDSFNGVLFKHDL